MGKSTAIILKNIRKSLIILFLIELSIILCLAGSLYKASKNETEKGQLIDVLGKQRMYTQKLAKAINNRYALLQAEELGDIIEPKATIDNKKKKIDEDIIATMAEFKNLHTQIKTGNIFINGSNIGMKRSLPLINSQIIDIDRIWSQIEKSVSIIISQEALDYDFMNAVIYINGNNEVLMEYCDSITKTIVNEKSEASYYYKVISIFSVILFFVTMVAALYMLYKYLIDPLDTFIEGMGNIGIIKEPLQLTKATKKEIVPVISEITKMSGRIETLISLIESINENLSIPEELEFIFHKFSGFIPYSYIGLALVKDDGQTLEAAYGIGDDSIEGLPQKFMGKRYAINSTSLRSVLNSGKARIINDLEGYIQGKKLKGYNNIIIGAGIKSSITLPLIVNNKAVGIIFFSSKDKNVYSDEHVRFLEVIAKSIAISFDKNIFVDSLLYSSILALAKLAEARDEDTGEHLDRMKTYSKTIAQLLFDDSKYSDQISLNFIDEIERFSPMHDIGKVGIRDGILLKPAKLTEEEFNEMKQHTIFGGKVLRAAEENILQSGRSMFRVGIEIAEGHHEKWNGSGYPLGKSGEDIPLSARIVAVADVFDALTSKRPYKKAFSFEESYSLITEGRGIHFDPEIIRVFNVNKDKVYKIYKSFKDKIEADAI